jgi:hypothetical protein
MFPDPHPDGYASPTGTVCELALPGQQISPHLALELGTMWAAAERLAQEAPPLSDERRASLQRILGQALRVTAEPS